MDGMSGLQLAHWFRPSLRGWAAALLLGMALEVVAPIGLAQSPQLARTEQPEGDTAGFVGLRSEGQPAAAHAVRARKFLGGRRGTAAEVSSAQAMAAARQQQLNLLLRPENQPGSSNLGAAWQPVGPNQVASAAYGNVTGRVTSIAIDPADATGNTVYLGTTGGGVWKSTNAAGPAQSVVFTPLTDTLPVFSANAGSSAIPSLSIGAVSVAPSISQGVVLAGTGDPNDATDSYYGGGLLRSADNGVTWTLIPFANDQTAGFHFFTGLGIAGFAWSSATPGLVVVAVSQAAEGVLVNAPSAGNSVMGLYYSTDAGQNWQMATLMDGGQVLQSPDQLGHFPPGHGVTAVVWNPVRQRFYAAVRLHGYYESADGQTWTRLAAQPGTGMTLTACPTSPLTSGSAGCPVFRGALAVQPSTGDTFALTVDSGNLDQGLWQDVCALSAGNCSSGAVTFGMRLTSTPLEAGNGSTEIPQGDYDLSLAAVASGATGAPQDTLLFAGTVDLYRCSLTAGCTLRNTTNAENACGAPAHVSPSQHAVAALATGALPLVYVGNDGGVWRSIDGVNQQAAPCSSDDANHFQNLNGGLGSLGEVVSFAESPTDASMLLVGLGANGTASTAPGIPAATPWTQLAPGEGGTVAIDPNDPLLWYLSSGAGVSLRQCSAGAACTAADFTGPPTIGAAQVSGDDSLIDAPWLLDPALSSNVVIGTCRVWRGPAGSGTSWSSANAISRNLAGPQNSPCGVGNPVVRSLAAGGVASASNAAENAGSPVLYAGMAGALDGGGSAGGHLFTTSAANTATNTTAWTDLTSSPVSNSSSGGFNPGGFDLSSVAADAHDASGKTVYVTVMGFAGNGINAAHIYRSVDGGAHWTNISANLPNAPANSVIVDPNDANILYVALDTGVYATSDVTTCTSTNCWSVYGTSLPNAPAVSLAAAAEMPTGDGRAGELRVATYGRGVWQIPLLTAAVPSGAAITLSPTNLTFGPQSSGTASAARTVTVTDSGSAPLSIGSLSVTGDFSETDTCANTTLASGASCQVQVTFLPSSAGSRTGVLTVYGNVPGGQATATLTGDGTAAAAIVLNPVILSFPTTTVNATSQVENITISNKSSSSIALQTPSVAGASFQITVNTCGPSLPADTGCTVGIAFVPVASGTQTGMLTIHDGAGMQTVSLSGIGTSPATDALAPLALTFAPQQIDTASAAQQVVLTNAGDQPLTLITAQITSGDFTVVNACGNSLSGHASCSMSVAFAPKNVGALTGVLSVSDQYRSQTVALNGFGLAPPGVSLAPFGSVSFPSTGVGVASAAQTVTLTNNGGVPLAVASTVITGDFAIAPEGSTCGMTLAAAAACTMQVVFTPTVGGPRTGTLTVTDNAPNSPQVLPLTGAGVDFTLNSNGPATVTTTNGQNAVFPLLLGSAANVSGTVSFACIGMPANSTCNVNPGSVALGNTTTISVTVLTGVASTASASRPLLRYGRTIVVAMLLPLGLFGARKRSQAIYLGRVAGAGLLCLLMVAIGCGTGRTIPLANNLNPNPAAGPVTAAGTYTIVVEATSAGLTRSVNLTLIVQ